MGEGVLWVTMILEYLPIIDNGWVLLVSFLPVISHLLSVCCGTANALLISDWLHPAFRNWIAGIGRGGIHNNFISRMLVRNVLLTFCASFTIVSYP